MVKNQPTFEEVFPQVKEILYKAKVVIAYNIVFEMQFLWGFDLAFGKPGGTQLIRNVVWGPDPMLMYSAYKGVEKWQKLTTVMDGLVNAVNAVKDFSDKHPVLTTVVEVGLGITATVVTGKVIDTKIKTKSSGSASHSLVNTQIVKTITDTAVDVISKFDFKKSESALKQLGYTVAKAIGLSDTERQKILQKAIANGVMSKDAICAFLENNINLHKNQATFAEAVAKWMSDLAFLKDV